MAGYEKLESQTEIQLLESDQSAYGSTNQEEPVQSEDHMKMSLIAFLCCMPCGILALNNASQVKKMYRVGNDEGASEASKKAHHYSVLSFRTAFFFYLITGFLLACGILFGLLYGIDSFRYR